MTDGRQDENNIETKRREMVLEVPQALISCYVYVQLICRMFDDDSFDWLKNSLYVFEFTLLPH